MKRRRRLIRFWRYRATSPTWEGDDWVDEESIESGLEFSPCRPQSRTNWALINTQPALWVEAADTSASLQPSVIALTLNSVWPSPPLWRLVGFVHSGITIFTLKRQDLFIYINCEGMGRGVVLETTSDLQAERSKKEEMISGEKAVKAFMSSE